MSSSSSSSSSPSSSPSSSLLSSPLFSSLSTLYKWLDGNLCSNNTPPSSSSTSLPNYSLLPSQLSSFLSSLTLCLPASSSSSSPSFLPSSLLLHFLSTVHRRILSHLSIRLRQSFWPHVNTFPLSSSSSSSSSENPNNDDVAGNKFCEFLLSSFIPLINESLEMGKVMDKKLSPIFTMSQNPNENHSPYPSVNSTLLSSLPSLLDFDLSSSPSTTTKYYSLLSSLLSSFFPSPFSPSSSSLPPLFLSLFHHFQTLHLSPSHLISSSSSPCPLFLPSHLICKIIEGKMEKYVEEWAERELPQWNEIQEFYNERVIPYVKVIVGNRSDDKYLPHLLSSLTQLYTIKRIQRIFDFIRDFDQRDEEENENNENINDTPTPSQLSLMELSPFLHKYQLHSQFLSSLSSSFRSRLLLPSINTSTILSLYINTIKAINIIEQQGKSGHSSSSSPTSSSSSSSLLYKCLKDMEDYVRGRNDNIVMEIMSITGKMGMGKDINRHKYITNNNENSDDNPSDMKDTENDRGFVIYESLSRVDIYKDISIPSLLDELEKMGDSQSQLGGMGGGEEKKDGGTGGGGMGGGYESDDERVFSNMNQFIISNDQWNPDAIDSHPIIPSSSSSSSSSSSPSPSSLSPLPPPPSLIPFLLSINHHDISLYTSSYQSLLSDELLLLPYKLWDYDTDSDIQQVEILKFLWGEKNMLQCDVMMKDVADSKMVNRNIIQRMKGNANGNNINNKIMMGEDGSTIPIHVTMISSEFWPSPLPFSSVKITPPTPFSTLLTSYSNEYHQVKTPRVLFYLYQYGLHDVSLSFNDGRKIRIYVNTIQLFILFIMEKEGGRITLKRLMKLLEMDEGEEEEGKEWITNNMKMIIKHKIVRGIRTKKGEIQRGKGIGVAGGEEKKTGDGREKKDNLSSPHRRDDNSNDHDHDVNMEYDDPSISPEEEDENDNDDDDDSSSDITYEIIEELSAPSDAINNSMDNDTSFTSQSDGMMTDHHQNNQRDNEDNDVSVFILSTLSTFMSVPTDRLHNSLKLLSGNEFRYRLNVSELEGILKKLEGKAEIKWEGNGWKRCNINAEKEGIK